MTGPMPFFMVIISRKVRIGGICSDFFSFLIDKLGTGVL